MAGNSIRKLVDRSLGTSTVDPGPEHAMTVKLPMDAYAKLRALVVLVGRPKTPLASEILVAAIDDFIEALPQESFEIDEALGGKMLGVDLPDDVEYTLADLVRWGAQRFREDDAAEAEKKERLMVSNIEAQLSGRSGATE